MKMMQFGKILLLKRCNSPVETSHEGLNDLDGEIRQMDGEGNRVMLWLKMKKLIFRH